MTSADRPSPIQYFTANTRGRDFAVGDIHGAFDKLQTTLKQVYFDPALDRLFSVGDMVDRGPYSLQALKWLAQPWFHAVQGNHEALCVSRLRYQFPDYAASIKHGMAWLFALDRATQVRVADTLDALPLAFQIETPEGPIGLIHADCSLPTWAAMKGLIIKSSTSAALSFDEELALEKCQWDRQRFNDQDMRGVPDLRALVVGHSIAERARVLGNVYHIDTGAWRESGRFTLLNLQSLMLTRSARAKAIA